MKEQNSSVTVEFAPVLERAAQAHENEIKQRVDNIKGALQMLSIEQLEMGVFMFDPNKLPDADCGRAFLQEIFKRDKDYALKTAAKWRDRKPQEPESDERSCSAST